MLKAISRLLWWLAAKVLGSSVVQRLVRRIERKLGEIACRLRDPAAGALQATLPEEKRRQLADRVVRLLLYGMSIIILLKPDFRAANLPPGFTASLVFRTKAQSNPVECSAIFADGRMSERQGAVSKPSATITFKDGLSLFDYVFFSKDHDVVNLLLENKVEIDGNLTVVYKFMYMVRHLIRPLGLA